MVDGKSRDIPAARHEARRLVTIAKALKDARENSTSARRDPRRNPGRLLARGRRDVARSGADRQGEAAHRLDGHLRRRAAVITSPPRAKPIYANPLTVTGTIGIFYGKADVSELIKKIGITTETYRTTPRADGESMYRPTPKTSSASSRSRCASSTRFS